jgi:hypothetical protein
MADLTPYEFARAVQDACHHSALVVSYDVQILDDVVVKIRAHLSIDAYIDVFYNADSGKCAYALISQRERLYGADNAFIGWHLHPFDNHAQHIASKAITFAEFLSTVEDRFLDDR